MSERRQRQLERKRVMRNRRIMIAVALVGVFILGIICGGRMVSASKPVRNSYKYYKEVKVDLGETLSDIAKTYMTEDYESAADYIAEVREINSICDDEIFYGQRLIVPYYSPEWK